MHMRTIEIKVQPSAQGDKQSCTIELTGTSESSSLSGSGRNRDLTPATFDPNLRSKTFTTGNSRDAITTCKKQGEGEKKKSGLVGRVKHFYHSKRFPNKICAFAK